MLRVWHRLNKLGESHEIGKIIYENTFGRGAARFRLDSLQYTVLLYCQLNQIPWMRVSPSAWKKKVIGKGTVGKLEYFEFAKKRWPEQRIWYDDQAAALCLLEYGNQ